MHAIWPSICGKPYCSPTSISICRVLLGSLPPRLIMTSVTRLIPIINHDLRAPIMGNPKAEGQRSGKAGTIRPVVCTSLSTHHADDPLDGEGKAGSSGSDPFPNVARSRDFGTLRPCFFPVLLPVYGNRVLRNLLCRASPSRPFFRRHVVWDLLQGRTLEGSRLWRTAPVKTLVGRHTYNRGIGLSSCNQAPDARCRTCEMRVNTRRSSTD